MDQFPPNVSGIASVCSDGSTQTKERKVHSNEDALKGCKGRVMSEFFRCTCGLSGPNVRHLDRPDLKKEQESQ